MEKIANGVWKVKLGQPEKNTPVSLSERKIQFGQIEKLSSNNYPPIHERNLSIEVTSRGCMITLPLLSSEKIYGFGLQLKSFCQNGHKKTLRTNADSLADSGDSHAPVPFYVSTAGYGVLVDTARYVSFYCGSSKRAIESSQTKQVAAGTTEELYSIKQASNDMIIDIPVAKGADIYLFEGPAMRDAICRYNLFSGGGCLPPMWGLGHLYRGYYDLNQDQALKLSEEIRSDKIPCDIFGIEPGWHSHAYSCTYEWNKERFPKHKEFLKELIADGYHINLWEQAFVYPEAPFYKEIEPYCGNFLVWQGLVPDFTLKPARNAFGNHHSRLLESGVSGFKLDECDGSDYTGGWSFPNCAKFPSGLDGEQMHSQLGIQFQKTQFDLFKSKNLRTYGQVRSSYALAASMPFVLYSDLYNHRDFVRGVANSGFSGLLWSPEVRQTESAEELIRRLQSTILSSQAVVNAWMVPNPPWRQYQIDKNIKGELLPEPELVRLTSICRGIFEFRMKLIPYLYSAFAKYFFEGLPPFRALVTDYPDDEQTYNIDDQFMIGDSIMAAPVIADEGNCRKIYLPKGIWYDYFTNERVEGGKWFERDVPLEIIPLYIKEGTILPIAKPLQNVAKDIAFEIDAILYGGFSIDTILFEDDGETFNFEKGEYNIVKLNWQENGCQLTRIGKYKEKRFIISSYKNIK